MTQETTRNRQLTQTERLMDELTLPQMIELMSEICYLKAEHLRENWQDNNSAKLWDKNGKQLSIVSGKLYS